ncbi:MotA/TolQ/ExbB proton channel family protein [Aminithiophilus ramosus]|uniref:MotA/TolQ/ExbB proton channel family protein n=1 Tax=Aminithiophilus ramosus TaxID=3029084 RepID=A0A9Q7AK96_9BACT|nr:MotA/TolQ/ExbB proton channel family protein [Aminithiophilus ramosus]QTX33095.1 MotA/TolQ/ExbB proton channel family protein [Aminithiophilus ramosus]
MDLSLVAFGGPVLWVIGGLSVVSFAVVVERLLFFRRNRTDVVALELELCKALHDRDRERASSLVQGADTSAHRLCAAAVSHWAVDREALRELLGQQVRRELFRWQKGLDLLATLARVAPLLGLLGTVLGMIDIFRILPEGGRADMAFLAAGIWKALITTVAGLSVAVPVILVHAYLIHRVDDEEETLLRTTDFLVREKLLGGDRP